MSEADTMLADMADALFAELVSKRDTETAWRKVEEVGLPGLLRGQDAGGFGGSWDDARAVLRLSGYYALPIALAESIMAAAAEADFEGRGTLAQSAVGRWSEGRFQGSVNGICDPAADYVIAPFEGQSLAVGLQGSPITQGSSIAGEGRGTLTFEGAQATMLPGHALRLGAFARTAQIAGALDAALAMAVGYVNERRQFGRALANFQAVQQNLATFAGEAAAANCAAVAAAQALDRGDGAFEIAAAKLRANRAVEVGAAIAHQVHGAIGFTAEYPLHRLTRRLWSWRGEFGHDAYWAAEIGGGVLQRGADRFWSHLTDRTD
jgi:acyl-CoA dehydrogenase